MPKDPALRATRPNPHHAPLEPDQLQTRHASTPLAEPTPRPLLPIGAALLAGGLGCAWLPALAQNQESTLGTVEVRADRSLPESKTTLRPGSTRIGKSEQELRDLPQSMTVQTERLMDDRNYDELRDVLRSTGGITFQAGETGEEDIRLRGFSLLQSGDVYVDGMRDPGIYDRDTFNYDRVEVLKGSASMLFGRGSTGGVVNQVNKTPFLSTAHEAKLLAGTGRELRATGDFNIQTGETTALRINAMKHQAGANGTRIDKSGLAPSYAWGIDTPNEIVASLYMLSYDNRPVYNAPWILSNGGSGEIKTPLDPRNYYGLANNYNRGSAQYGTLTYTHRGDQGSQWRSSFRHGLYTRDLWASVIGFDGVRPSSEDAVNDNTVLSRRSQKGRIARSRITTLQSDYEDRYITWGLKHKLQLGIDLSNEDALRANNFPGASPTGNLATTRVGTPDDGGSQADLRGDAPMNSFNARNWGIYVQDTLELTPHVKLVGGLRSDSFVAGYYTATGDAVSRSDTLWSPRAAVLFQPDETASYHLSYGSSYNVSGDTYQYAVRGPSARVANTPPEQSVNTEIGAKYDLFRHKLLLGISAFYTEKYNERNTDPDTAATQELLSGKRHAMGLDVDLIGQISPAWEVFASWTWIPDAKIDNSNVARGGASLTEGDRPGLTPVHTASTWTTYRLSPQWRVGAGLNYRGPQTPEVNRRVISREFTTLDLMAEYTLDPRTSLKLNVNNATDERYADGLYNGFYLPGAAMSAQLSLKVLFD